MVQMSILDKLGIFIQTFFTSKLPLLFILIAFIFYYCKKVRKTITKKEAYILYGIFSFIVLVIYHQEILSAFDYIMTNLLTGYYFPDLALYFLIVMISHIAFLSIFFYSRWTKKIRNLWIGQFVLIETDFLLFLYLVSKNKLNVSDTLSLYQNESVFALLELVTLIAFITFILLILCLILDREKIFHRKTEQETIVEPTVVEVQKPVIQTEVVYRDKDMSVLKEGLKNFQTELNETDIISSHELRMLKIKQKKDLLKIYKKMMELQIHLNDEDCDIQDDFDDIEALLDDTETNTEQNFKEYINQKENTHKNQMKKVNQLLENNL